MALRFVDNFAIYGTGATGRTNMLRTHAGWVEIVDDAGGDDVWPVTTRHRQNGTHSLRMILCSTTTDVTRFSLGGTITTAIVGAAFYFEELPTADDKVALFNFLDSGNGQQLTLCVDPSGRLRVLRGALGGTEVANSDTLSPVPPITTGSFVFVEIKSTIDDAAGTVTVRVNNQAVISATGLDTKGTSTAGVAMIGVGRMLPGGIADGELYVADVYACDTLGGDNDDFLGDTEWFTVWPDHDANTGYSIGSESSPPDAQPTRYQSVNEVTPDDDATFIQSADAAPSTQLFGLSALPASTSEIVGVCTRPLMRKIDAGASSVVVSLRQTAVSPVAESDGDTRSVTEDYLYYSDYHDVDPATGVAFTPATFGDVQLQIERTA